MKELCYQYDGFCFEKTARQRVFSPWSLLNYFAYPKDGLEDYWFESGGRPSVLNSYMRSHYLKNPEEYESRKSISLDRLSASSSLENLSDIGLLTQAGYLTIKSVEDEVAILDYPNAEVRKAMAQLYLEQILGGKNMVEADIVSISKILAQDSGLSVFKVLNNLFRSIDYQNYPIKNGATLRAMVQVYLAGSGLFPLTEMHNCHGRSDLEVQVGKKRWVFEFKVIRDGENEKQKLMQALEQLRQKEYGLGAFDGDLSRMALVFFFK